MSGILFLVDESAAMNTPVALPMGVADSGGARKTKLESIATLINSNLNKLAQSASGDVAVVGYRTDADGTAVVGPRWGGSLAGRAFVPLAELPGSEIAVEPRTRKVPGAGGLMEEQPFNFPLWYTPEPGQKAPQVAAFDSCFELLSSWSGSDIPIVIHLFAGASSDGNPLKAVQRIQEMGASGGSPLVFHAHLGSSDNVPSTVFASNRAYLRSGPMRDLFDRSSLLPEPLAKALKAREVRIQEKARGMLYNARMVDVSRLAALASVHLGAGAPQPASAPTPSPSRTPTIEAVEDAEPYELDVADEPSLEAVTLEPADDLAVESANVELVSTEPEQVGSTFVPEADSVSSESPALVMFVLDRSLDDPFADDPENAFTKLRDQLSELVGQVTKVGDESIDAGIVSYGLDGQGDQDIRTQLEGGLAGRNFARDHEIMDGAVFDDSYVEERSDGIGNILSIPHSRPVLVEVEPTSASAAEPAFAELAQLISSWCADHPTSTMPPVVLHLTRGRLDPSDVEAAAATLSSIATSNGEHVRLYHLVITEDDHAAVSYAENDDELKDESLKAIFWASSPLLCGAQIAEDKPEITSQSRGFVLNGRFTLLLDAIKRAIDN